MIERVISVGGATPLVGVLTEPEVAQVRNERPAVILLNAGLLHRVGPHRLYVDVARELARAGFLSVRMDLSGLGDSPPRNDQLSFEQGSVEDTLRLMNHLGEKRGVQSFIVGGLCSGADNAFWASLVDQRILGVMLLDWYAYRTPRFYLHHYGPKILRSRTWANKLAIVTNHLRQAQVRRVLPAAERAAPQAAAVQLNPFARAFPPKERITPLLQQVIARGVRMLCVYTRGQLDFYNYRTQFRDMFRSVHMNGQVRTEFLETADHTFTLRKDQLKLRSTVTSWVRDTNWSKPAITAPVVMNFAQSNGSPGTIQGASVTGSGR
jgi:pimeloyl-ACP methyl ester carboxylesterase